MGIVKFILLKLEDNLQISSPSHCPRRNELVILDSHILIFSYSYLIMFLATCLTLFEKTSKGRFIWLYVLNNCNLSGFLYGLNLVYICCCFAMILHLFHWFSH